MNMVIDNEMAIDLWKIIAHHGYANQKEKAIEELTELAQALARDLQGDGDRANITEEMGDCYIMLSQLQLIYGNHGEIIKTVMEKLEKTLDRVEQERRGGKEP